MSDDLLGLLPQLQDTPTEDGGLLGALERTASSPLLGLAAGLLEAGGPSREPISLGQGLGRGLQLASGLERSRLENEATRRALSARARQREARQGLLGRIEEGGPALDDPETLGLLARAEPELFAEGILGQAFGKPTREPELIQTLRAAGFDPRDPDLREKIKERALSQGMSEERLRALELGLTQLELQERRAERERSERTEREREIGRRQTLFRNAQKLQEAADLNRDLQGTFLETGVGADTRVETAALFNQVLSLAGFDRSKQEKEVSKFQRLSKDLNDLVIRTRDRFGSTITNDQLRLLTNASANTGISPRANAAILASIGEITLDQAERQGVEIGNREELEALIERERRFANAETETSAERTERPAGSREGGGRQEERSRGLPQRATVRGLEQRPELDVQVDSEGNFFLVDTESGAERRLKPRELRSLGLIRGER